jgi:hypothetical protein
MNYRNQLVRLTVKRALALILGAAPMLAAAQDAAETGDAVPKEGASHPFKFTVGSYSVAGGGLPAGPGLDVNLRYTYGEGNVWLGWFRSPALDFSQTRVGWDNTLTFGPVRALPSLQAASGGFVGGSIAIETGDSWFIGSGLGRTNLRNYANLNFDPNDSYTLYGGYRWPDASALSLQLVRDNRLNPDQQHLHLIWRKSLSDGQRLTVDLLAKQGTVEGQFIRRTGLSVGYDWPQWFVRLAWDPKVNFTPQNMLRVSTGWRF